MKKYLLCAGIALLLAVAVPANGLAADAWLLDTSVTKAKITATLTFTDVSLGKSVTVKYKPTGAKVRIERNVDGETGRHVTSVSLSKTQDTTSLDLNAGMLGSGLKIGNSTSVVAGINPETDTETPFVFNDNAPGFHSMAAANVMASSAEGKYDEVVDKTGLPSGNINLNLTYTIVGNLDTTGAPAKIVVQVSAKNVPPEHIP